MTAVGIIGPGRAGVGFGLALSRAGHAVFIHGEHEKVLPVPLELSWGGTPPWLAAVDIVLLAVPDDALEQVATDLAATGKLHEGQTVLHLAGLLDHSALASLSASGAALGSLHPLQSLASAATAADRLKGAFAAVEGDERAVAAASALARTIGLRPITVASQRKVLYHAGAVFASNYLVVVEALAERLLVEAGFEPAQAREALGPLMAGTIANFREAGPAALTGPVRRGDANTIRQHLAALPEDVRDVYGALARAALALTDLPAAKRKAVEKALREE